MHLKNTICAVTAVSLIATGVAFAGNITIATVNNGDMIRMQGLTKDFTDKTGHTVEWVTLEENVLRQRVTTDITTKGGAFDVMTIGMYETAGSCHSTISLRAMIPTTFFQPCAAAFPMTGHCTRRHFMVKAR